MCENLEKIGLLIVDILNYPLDVAAICSMVLVACYLFVYALFVFIPGYWCSMTVTAK